MKKVIGCFLLFCILFSSILPFPVSASSSGLEAMNKLLEELRETRSTTATKEYETINVPHNGSWLKSEHVTREDYVYIIIPECVDFIGAEAFKDCEDLKEVLMPSKLNNNGYIGNSAFRNCSSLESITIPDGTYLIDNHAFRDCSSLEEIEIPGSCFQIREQAFQDCTSLTSVVLEDGVSEIQQRAFEGCTSLTYVEIPASVKTIGWNAFKDTGLSCIYVHNGTSIPNDVGVPVYKLS